MARQGNKGYGSVYPRDIQVCRVKGCRKTPDKYGLRTYLKGTRPAHIKAYHGKATR